MKVGWNSKTKTCLRLPICRDNPFNCPFISSNVILPFSYYSSTHRNVMFCLFLSPFAQQPFSNVLSLSFSPLIFDFCCCIYSYFSSPMMLCSSLSPFIYHLYQVVFFLLLSLISFRLFYLSPFTFVFLLLCINYFVVLYLSFPYLSLFSPTPYLIILFVSLFLFFFIKNTLFYFYHLLLCIFLYLSFSYLVRNKRVHSGIGCRQFLQKKKNLYLFF